MKGFENVSVHAATEKATPIMMSVDKCKVVPDRIKLLGGTTRKTEGGDTMFCFDCEDSDGNTMQMWTFERDISVLIKDWGENISNWPDGWVSFKKNLSGTRWIPYPSKNQHTEQDIQGVMF